MRILVVNWQDLGNPLAGGAEVHLHEVFSRIAAAGHHVTVLCSRFPGAQREEVVDGLRIVRAGGRFLFNFTVLREYIAGLRGEKFDVVVDDMNKIPFFTPLYVREPVCGIMHHLFGRSIYQETNPLVASYVYLMERAAVGLYRRRRTPFIAVSPSTRDELIERGLRKDDVTIIHLAVDHALHRRTGISRSPTPLIGYFGRLKKYKCVDHILRALPSVLRSMPELKFLIVGDGDDRPRLEAVAARCGIAHAVQFTGFVPPGRKVELLQQMWFKVASSSKEGWGLTVLEANACGTPVLASNVPGLRDAVRDNETGLLYRFGDIADLGKKMELLLGDRVLRERLGASSVVWAGKFTWENAAQKTLELLEHKARAS